jgi:hypothetical protein
LLAATPLAGQDTLGPDLDLKPPPDGHALYSTIGEAIAEATRREQNHGLDTAGIEAADFEALLCEASGHGHAPGQEGKAQLLQGIDRSIAAIEALTQDLPPDTGQQLIRDKFEEHGCNWRGVVAGPEEIPAIAAGEDFIREMFPDPDGILKMIREVEELETARPGSAGSTPMNTFGRPVPSDQNLSDGRLTTGSNSGGDASPVTFNGTDQYDAAVESLAKIYGGSTTPEEAMGRSTKVVRICERYKNLEHTPECVAILAHEDEIEKGEFTAQEFCEMSQTKADSELSEAVTIATLAAYATVLTFVYVVADEAADIYFDESASKHKWDRRHSQKIIDDGTDRLVEIDFRLGDLDRTEEEWSADDIIEVDALNREKAEIERDIKEAEENIERIRQRREYLRQFDDPIHCEQLQIESPMQLEFEDYKKHVEAMARQCRREIDWEFAVAPEPQPQDETQSSCDLEGLREDLGATTISLSHPETQAELAQRAFVYRLERQAAWRNLSCPEQCFLDGGQCTLNNENETVCIPAEELYMQDLEEVVDRMTSQTDTLKWQSFNDAVDLEAILGNGPGCSGESC